MSVIWFEKLVGISRLIIASFFTDLFVENHAIKAVIVSYQLIKLTSFVSHRKLATRKLSKKIYQPYEEGLCVGVAAGAPSSFHPSS